MTEQPTLSVPLNDLRRGYRSMAAELQCAVAEVLESGWYVHGPQHAGFETEFSEFVGTSHCFGVANGTDALEIALRGLDLKAGAEVVTVANAGMYATTSIRRAGLEARYADIDPATLLMTAGTLEAVLRPSVKAVVVTHLYGRLADMGPLLALCREHGIAVVEDCAQAVGAVGPLGAAGSLGDIAAFSFYPTKNLGALGDGGAITTDDDRLAARIRGLRQYGWDAKYTVKLEGGRNSRLDELQAAVLRVRLPRVAEWNAQRRSIIAAYAAAATGTSITVLPACGESHAGHLAVALVDDRDAARVQLLAGGVGTEVHYPIPDHRQPLLSEAYASTHLPVTEELSRRVVSLPCFPELTEGEIARVCLELSKL